MEKDGCVLHKLSIDLKSAKIDMLSLSGHKLHAPKGIGVLYVRRNTRFRPLLLGGDQERGRRAGTANSASIVGLGVACDLARQHMEEENTVVKRLRDHLERGILARVPNAFVNGDTPYRLPNTASIAFEYVEGEGILLLLNPQGIAAVPPIVARLRKLSPYWRDDGPVTNPDQLFQPAYA